MFKKVNLPALQAYWLERVVIEADRLTVLGLIGAATLALKHPEVAGAGASILRDAIQALMPLVMDHVPAEVLAEWDQVLRGR